VGLVSLLWAWFSICGRGHNFVDVVVRLQTKNSVLIRGFTFLGVVISL